MRTTIEIPDAMFRRLKRVAGSQGISLNRLFTEAIQEKLQNTTGSSDQPPWMKLAGAFGKTAAARAETRRVQKCIDDEFDRFP